MVRKQLKLWSTRLYRTAISFLTSVLTIAKEYLRLRVNRLAFREDARKLGIFCLGAGIVGMVLANDTATIAEGSILFLLGIVAWFIGLHKDNDSDGSST